MVELFANSGDPDQKPCDGASDLGLPIIRLGVPILQWVKCHRNKLKCFKIFMQFISGTFEVHEVLLSFNLGAGGEEGYGNLHLIVVLV